MKRNKQVFSVKNLPKIKEQILYWINQFSVCSFLDNHEYDSEHHSIECIAAAGEIASISGPNTASLIDAFYKTDQDWLFGHFGYDYHANQLNSQHKKDQIGFSDAFFFRPDHLLTLTNHSLVIESYSLQPEYILGEITSLKTEKEKFSPIKTTPSISKNQYLSTVEKLLSHIQKGDCYEINLCQEFHATDVIIDPILLYIQLTSISPTPFACYYKEHESHLICASPERWLKKQGNKIISQPIKGTVKRELSNIEMDIQLKKELFYSSKDRSENVMVVDLVRNDFSRVCKAGSVQVDELYGIYSFPQVHQMISTISGQLLEDVGMEALVETGFPMGSMTGAPKKKVMELIHQYEPIQRGVFSGAVGYINPQKDFDFNVVIRSLLYNPQHKYLSYLVGSGITIYSDPVQEYEECLLKAKAMETVLGN
ncbi:anthranilate synthase component I family protein [Sediminibacterium sp.]|uniref:anthranilate synthase component I family protein n=1 Tax=Sediminibacterium sp. TaxID=1917865 RepID=UPI003F72BBF0